MEMVTNMKTRITIDVSAHLQNGKFIGDEHLKMIRWQLETLVENISILNLSDQNIFLHNLIIEPHLNLIVRKILHFLYH